MGRNFFNKEVGIFHVDFFGTKPYFNIHIYKSFFPVEQYEITYIFPTEKINRWKFDSVKSGKV